jgi:hypothetical protein
MYSTMLEELSKAIGARMFVQFSYRGYVFVVEPHLIGRNHDMQNCLRAWTLTTDSASDVQAGWHCFNIDDISDIQLLEKRFDKIRPGYDPYDSTMSRIYYRA